MGTGIPKTLTPHEKEYPKLHHEDTQITVFEPQQRLMEHIGIHLSRWSDTYLSISTGFQDIFSLIFEGHPSNFRINSRAVIKKHAEDGVT